MMREGRSIAVGAPEEIMERTGTSDLEDAFLKLTMEVDQ